MTAPTAFPHLFEPFRIRNLTIRNRILSTGHDTVLPTDGTVNDALIAYHEARAKGGAGLIISQVAGVHETARYTSHLLMADDDRCIPGYRRLAEVCHRHGTALFSQLFHPGREIMESANGMLAVAWSASAVPNERFHVMPRAMDEGMIAEIVAGYAAAARRMAEAGLDGVEVVASHGYLPAQFLNPRVNLREDGYGGSDAGRLRFLVEVLGAVRQATGPEFVIGLRLSMTEKDEAGLTAAESLAACRALEDRLDFVNLTVGSSATVGGAVHIVPPMAFAAGYLGSDARTFRQALKVPVFVAGRINQPQEAEAMLKAGMADMCGMTRALICDPEMPVKAEAGRFDDIRACIGCNQACIGHFHRGLPISCIQHPETGRELALGAARPAPRPRRILVVGGGPAGLKAAAVAAERGHEVTLCEGAAQLGGQALLAQLLPRRAEFGGIVTNLAREAERAGVTIRRSTPVTPEFLAGFRADAVILATGAQPYRPEIVSDGAMQVVDAWQVLQRQVTTGGKVLVADWRADWIGPGLAEMLAREGRSVDLAVNGLHVGEALPLYVRDTISAELHRAGVRVTPYARLFGTDGDTVYLQHTASDLPMPVEGVETLVLSTGHQPRAELWEAARALGAEVHRIGDCAAPRTAEEAVYEGMLAGRAV